jgi:hypothetical protein
VSAPEQEQEDEKEGDEGFDDEFNFSSFFIWKKQSGSQSEVLELPIISERATMEA